MDETVSPELPTDCVGVGDLIGRIGDKWTVQVVVALLGAPRRFNDLRRGVPGLSQQMLTRTLKALERDGFVSRTVYPTTPPQVDYALTDLGRSLSEPLQLLASWAVAQRGAIADNRARYDAGQERAAVPLQLR